MSLWLLLDVFLFHNEQIIPCFFLLGFVTDKKVSWFSILTVSIFFDWILFSTKYLFFLLCCILKIISFLLFKNKRTDYFNFFLIFVSFYLILNFSQGFSIPTLWNINLIYTYLISNFFLFCFIKWKNHS